MHINGTLPTLTPTHNIGPTNNKTGIELGEPLLPPHPALTQQEVLRQATHNLIQAEAALQHPQPATETTPTTATELGEVTEAVFSLVGLIGFASTQGAEGTGSMLGASVRKIWHDDGLPEE